MALVADLATDHRNVQLKSTLDCEAGFPSACEIAFLIVWPVGSYIEHRWQVEGCAVIARLLTTATGG